MLGNSLTYNANWNEILGRSKIQTLNNWLTEFALEDTVEFLDINRLVSKNDYLRDDLTYDGIHLNAGGYALWAPEVGKVLAKYKL